MADSSGATCAYVFDPETWEERTGMKSPLYQSLLDDGDVWECPHESHDGSDRCLFHLPPEEKDAAAVREAFLSKIDIPGKESKQFIGARFGAFNLSHAIIECRDNHMIDLRHARFEGEANWRYAICRQPLALEGALFETRPIFTETTFASEVYLTKARFQASARFIEAEFAQGVWGYKTRFAEAQFHLAEFGGPVDFSQVRFESARFRQARFDEQVEFQKASFEHATFSGARFDTSVYFDEATVPADVNMQKAHVGDLISVENLQLSGETCRIDLSESYIPSGRLFLSSSGTTVYDLTDATVGDVLLADGTPPDGVFDHFRLLHTTFDGFDFGLYRDALHEANWQLHDVVESADNQSDDEPSPGELENTYLKAKNGANAIGDTKAAAEFFRKEMLYRREQYLPTALDRSETALTRVSALGRWVANTVLNVTAGYGERPSRVVGVSVGMILLFGGLFAAVQPDAPYGTPVGYLILSLESFITLVLGGAEDIANPWIRLLAEIEGFVGAFLVALFVFTLTRSIHR